MSRLARALRAEPTGGLLLVAGAVLALALANSPWSSAYADLRELTVGPAALHLDLSLGAWAADGLLAIFFFVVGLELKREVVAGDLREPRRALLPVGAAVGGMVAPAVVFVLWNLGDGEALRGWAIPTATDIAFAVAVLALIGRHLPAGLRTFLLTLAVVDDLLAITVIAVFYAEGLHLGWLLLALVPLGAFALAARHPRAAYALIPLAVVTWALVHASGVHATVAGVLLAVVVPVARLAPLEHLVRPVSVGIAVPVFAFFASGVALSGLGAALTDRVALGVVTGLVVGKVVGIVGATWLLTRFTAARLDEDLAWVDVVGLALLGGIGFTVSLLIGELAFGPGSARADHVKVGVLCGSLLSALLATAVLRSRNRTCRRILDDADG